jgi:hypothetical protein
MWVRALALALVLFTPAQAAAEWQIKPFLGVTFGGGTTFLDVEQAVGKPNIAFGVTAVVLGDVIGIEGDWSHLPGFLNGDRRLVLRSRVRTLTGNIVVAWPRRLAEYTLRPYFVAGTGAVQVRWDDNPLVSSLSVESTLPAIDVGGGVTGFISDRFGLSWDVRHFRGIGSEPKQPGSTNRAADERLSFWRANMSVAIRY